MDKKKQSNRSFRFYLSLFLLIGILALELAFDVFEIAIGQVLLFTNPLRPKVGRLWDEELKDVSGSEELGQFLDSVKQDSVVVNRITTFDDLQATLSVRESVTFSRSQFRDFYRSIPTDRAKALLDPLIFLDLNRKPEWHSVRVSLSDDQLVVYYLDGYGQLIFDSYLDFGSFGQTRNSEQPRSPLDEDPVLNGQIISAETFFAAYENLARIYRLQIVNDPYKLVQWGEQLRRVAIAPVVEEEGVKFIFEIARDNRVSLHSMYASEIATEYLINEIRHTGAHPGLRLLKERDEEEPRF